MSSILTYGYEPGLLSNSMLQAAITCPLKYKMLYIDGVDPKRNGIHFDATFVGNVIHHVIENTDDDYAAGKELMWKTLEDFFGVALIHRTKSLFRLYEEAREKTMEEGRKWGREYKAPEMTGFWKKNYGGLQKLLDRLNIDAQNSVEGGVFDEPFCELVRRMVVCLNNWPAMRMADPTAVEIEVRGIMGEDNYTKEMVGKVDRLEARGNNTALCDLKTGKWGYNYEKLANSDQFGLYHTLLTRGGANVVEWAVYDLYTGTTTKLRPTSEITTKFEYRINTNLRYFTQLEKMFDGGFDAPVPAGSPFKVGCPCILAKTGDCTYYVQEENQ